jgi:peptide/nickel transport system permease protein
MTQAPTEGSAILTAPVTPAAAPVPAPGATTPDAPRRPDRGLNLAALAKRVIRLLFVLYLVVTASFFMLQLLPGDPAATALGPGASPEDYAQARHLLGLDRPVLQSYLDYLDRLVHGNLGKSLFPPRQSVVDLLTQRAPVTLELAILALVVAIVLAVPAAMFTAARRTSVADKALTGVSFAWISIPSFLSGLLLVYLCVFEKGIARTVLAALFLLGAAAVGRSVARQLREPAIPNDARNIAPPAVAALVLLGLAALSYAAFPDFATQGFTSLSDSVGDNIKSIVLPVLALALTEAAVFVRVLRSDLLHTLGEDFILAARAKGMPPWRIMTRDALRPSLFSLVTVVSVSLGRLIGGSVIIESLFNLPGLGNLVFEAVTRKNYPVVQGCVLTIATFYILINLVVDIAYSYLDPRIRGGA